jgi:hypothetical protein
LFGSLAHGREFSPAGANFREPNTSTSAQSIVDAIDAAILSMANGGGAQSISVGGRSVTYHKLEDLTKLRAVYAAMVGTSTTGKMPFKFYHTKPNDMGN